MLSGVSPRKRVISADPSRKMQLIFKSQQVKRRKNTNSYIPPRRLLRKEDFLNSLKEVKGASLV